MKGSFKEIVGLLVSRDISIPFLSYLNIYLSVYQFNLVVFRDCLAMLYIYVLLIHVVSFKRLYDVVGRYIFNNYLTLYKYCVCIYNYDCYYVYM